MRANLAVVVDPAAAARSFVAAEAERVRQQLQTIIEDTGALVSPQAAPVAGRVDPPQSDPLILTDAKGVRWLLSVDTRGTLMTSKA